MTEKVTRNKLSLGMLRIALGAYMLWAFLDKMFGLNYTTSKDSAWINGGSPTTGFLKFGTSGKTFEDVFSSLAGQLWVDWVFMIGLLGIGIALILGIGVRIAGISGTIMMSLMYLASIPFEKSVDHNPLIDDHIIYGIAFLFFAFSADLGKYLGLGSKWEKLEIVKKYPILL